MRTATRTPAGPWSGGGFRRIRVSLKMIYRLLADCVVLVHATFVAFVMLGGFLAWRWRAVVWAHVPAALWGAAIEYGGWVCPLTPLENALRARAGLEGYRGGFVEHYVIPDREPESHSARRIRRDTLRGRRERAARSRAG